MKKLNIGKTVLALSIMSTISVSSVFTAFAGQWEQTGEQWKYKNDNDSYATNGWTWVGEDCYYFDENGLMLSSTITPDGYVVNENGAWIQEAPTTAQSETKYVPVGGWNDEEGALELGREIQQANGWKANAIAIYSQNTAGFGETSADAITLKKTSDSYQFDIYVKLNNSINKQGLQALSLLISGEVYDVLISDYSNENLTSEWQSIGSHQYKVEEGSGVLHYYVK